MRKTLGIVRGRIVSRLFKVVKSDKETFESEFASHNLTVICEAWLHTRNRNGYGAEDLEIFSAQSMSG